LKPCAQRAIFSVGTEIYDKFVRQLLEQWRTEKEEFVKEIQTPGASTGIANLTSFSSQLRAYVLRNPVKIVNKTSFYVKKGIGSISKFLKTRCKIFKDYCSASYLQMTISFACAIAVRLLKHAILSNKR